MKKVWCLLIPAVILAIASGSLYFYRNNISKNYGMFCWDENIILQENRNKLKQVIKKAGVHELYQEFGALANEDTAAFLKDMNRQKVAVYALIGKAEWGLEKDGATLCREIEAIGQENQTLKYGIQGIMVDVEPYVLEQWDSGAESRRTLIQGYVEGMTAAYQTAKKYQLELLACIPTFYSSTNPQELKHLVEDGCDGIAIMNYNRENEYAQIVDEVELARQNNKRVICIYELQAPGKHDLEDINTYYHIGLKVLHASRQTLQKQLEYEKLGFAYHYYEPLYELLQETPR